jgi:hypothetical protein
VGGKTLRERDILLFNRRKSRPEIRRASGKEKVEGKSVVFDGLGAIKKKTRM